MKSRYDVVIVGGGAVGLSAAVFAARRIGGQRVLVLEKQARVGKKLLATGNGTCNISNIHADESHYHGANPAFVKTAFRMFSTAQARAFFDTLGLPTVVREDGRVYPFCLQASAVLDCLRMELERLGVETCCDTPVSALKPRKNGVVVVTEQGEIMASRVLVAAGGAASASLGGCVDGYRLLCDLGHTKTAVFPSIVQIRTDRDAVKAVKGIRLDAALSLCLDGKTVAASQGEVLFADYGVSGPAAMYIGRAAADWERRKKGTMTVVIDCLPTLTQHDVKTEIEKRCAMQGMTLENMFVGLLQKRLGQTLVKAAGLMPLSRETASLTAEEKATLAHVLKSWTIPVIGCAGMNAAQVTAGGIATSEFDPSTMRSRLVPFVYAAGEVLDIDGDCGGFNLQWAWASAYTAAMAMTEDLA